MSSTSRAGALGRVGRRLARWSLAAAVVLVAAAFPFGPLFPWSPWKPGYDRVALERADVFYPSGTVLPAPFREVDEYIRQSEAFHGLPVSSRLCVTLCRGWGDVQRFLPQLGGSHAVGAAAMLTGTAIYVTPRVAERGFDPGEFVRHEISHATLHQHQSLWQAYQTRRAESFFEGLAVSFGRQRAFVSTADALSFVREHDLGPIFDPQARDSGRPRDMRLNYTVWRLFVEYLRELGGRARFQALLERTMANPDRYASLLSGTYGFTQETLIQHFQAAVRAGWGGAGPIP
jgi:hypothetical protein